MTNSIKTEFLLAAGFVALFATGGCERDTSGLAPAPLDTNPVVFSDVFDGIDYEAFGDSKLDALDVVTDEVYAGEAAIEVTVPETGYAGGAITANMARDLSQYNALAFWAKASKNATLNEVGYGNDNTGTSKYPASIKGLALTTTWQRYILPIPTTGKLVPERGLFFFAEGPEGGSGYTIWFDEIVYTNVDAISNPRPRMDQPDVNTFAGTRVNVSGTSTQFDVTVPTTRSLTVDHSAAYFTLLSSSTDVAEPGEGVVRVVGGGTANITARLDSISVAGQFTINSLDPPTVAAPRPTIPAGDVISIFSGAYSNRPVDTFSSTFDEADVSDFRIAGNDVKVYIIKERNGRAIIEFASSLIDASSMTHVHIDAWIPSGTYFGLSLFSFGPDGVYSGDPPPQGDDSRGFASTQDVVFEEWMSLDFPLSDFTGTGLEDTSYLAQLFLFCDAGQFIVDNIFFYKDGSQAAPAADR